MIHKVEEYVESLFNNDSTGHDWFHIQRVRRLALHIGKEEKANLLMVEIIALLHDVLDDKITANKDKAKDEIAALLSELPLTKIHIDEILYTIENIGFKGGNGIVLDSLEGKVVQDADRLDALGAIGAARTFMYSGAKGQAMYDPQIEVRTSMSYEQYRGEKSTAINHFHEKLFLLKDTLQTEEAKKIALERHEFMKKFVDQFMKEWNEI
ncbi:MAG: HD domain-containing protein [Bacillota bacterium]|uniref:HD domain-containing protein n=1 Tax=Bacillus sp. RO2 TaxID=2723913 RepID=UPI00145E6711|nr:HD domain-containing protein [Bacillus sp. RO2]MEA3319133.1 HD domain-containing protein [Bacillota bacterium]NMH72216.1 HD domain-containing protein [Bacillus sp. RO2]